MLKWKYGLWQIESTMLMCEDKLTANQIDDQENCVLDIKCQKKRIDNKSNPRYWPSWWQRK